MKDSGIQWTTHTFNPWRGCTKVSPGCANCYAEALSKRNPKVLGEWGPGKPRQVAAEDYWQEPYRWEAEARANVVDAEFDRPRVFCASLSDWLDDDGVPIEWLARLLKTIHATPSLDWLLLTKRPENWRGRVGAALMHVSSEDAAADGSYVFPIEMIPWLQAWVLGGTPPSNVWVGATAEDQKRAEERVPELVKIPARVRFLSCEPLLNRVDLRCLEDGEGNTFDALTGQWEIDGRGVTPPSDDRVHWVIVGGESGSEEKARRFDLEHARRIVADCRSAGVPVFVKQLGLKPIEKLQHKDLHLHVTTEPYRLPLKDKKGGDMTEWPKDLQVREFPWPVTAERRVAA